MSSYVSRIRRTLVEAWRDFHRNLINSKETTRSWTRRISGLTIIFCTFAIYAFHFGAVDVTKIEAYKLMFHFINLFELTIAYGLVIIFHLLHLKTRQLRFWNWGQLLHTNICLMWSVTLLYAKFIDKLEISLIIASVWWYITSLVYIATTSKEVI